MTKHNIKITLHCHGVKYQNRFYALLAPHTIHFHSFPQRCKKTGEDVLKKSLLHLSSKNVLSFIKYGEDSMKNKMSTE